MKNQKDKLISRMNLVISELEIRDRHNLAKMARNVLCKISLDDVAWPLYQQLVQDFEHSAFRAPKSLETLA